MTGAERVSSIRTAPATRRIAARAYDAFLEALSVILWNKAPFERFHRVSLGDHPELLAGLTFSVPWESGGM